MKSPEKRLASAIGRERTCVRATRVDRFALMLVALGGCAAEGRLADGGHPDAAASDAGTPDARATDARNALDGGDRTITTLRIVYPEGAAMTVRGSGSPLDWDSGLLATPMAGGLYVLETDTITAPVEWKPLLDDTTWARGPNYHVEPGQTVEIAPHFTPSSGRVIELLSPWHSAALGNDRAVWAYLPASYDENTVARFPVVYMHDGQNLFDPLLAFGGNEWQVDETMNGAAESGRCPNADVCANDAECGGARCDTFREAIVVGIANTPDRVSEYTPTMDADVGDGGRGDLYVGALADELHPVVDGMLRTRTAREDTALLGSSLGGLISAHGGVTRPDAFGLIGAMSPSTWWDGRVILTEVATIPSHPSRALRVYLDSGDSGASNDGVTDTADLDRAYEDAGYVEGADLHYLVAPGHEHNEVYWRQRLPGALAFLLGPRERPSP